MNQLVLSLSPYKPQQRTLLRRMTLLNRLPVFRLKREWTVLSHPQAIRMAL